jgi:peptidoglycan/xylan/chitin deacetylase (PgdA/CDA1 family)
MNAMPIPILLYHAVSADPPRWLEPWNVTPDVFAEQLDTIVENGCTPFTVSGLVDMLLSHKELPERPIVITFDDGFADFATYAAPALAERDIPSTIYVTTGTLAGRQGARDVKLPPAAMLSWSDLAELEQLGVEIGGHSHTHPELDTLSAERAAAEILRPKELLEDVLGHVVPSFAYPHGYSSPRIRRITAEAGYGSACAVRNAFSSVSDNLYALSRLTVRDFTPMSTVSAWSIGTGATVAPPGERRRTQLWRWYRRAHLDSIAGAPFAAAAARGADEASR